MFDEITAELVKQMAVMKEIDKVYEASGYSQQFKNIQYVEREEDPELRAQYEKNLKKQSEFSSIMKDKTDGEISIDLHGNIAREGIKGTGTYVMRNG